MTQDMSIEQIAEWHARTADVERDPEIRAFHRRAARVLQTPCERVPDPIAHGPFFDGLQDMPYGGSRQTTEPIETPEDATAAIRELQTMSGECTCLSISRDPLCVYHGVTEIDEEGKVHHRGMDPDFLFRALRDIHMLASRGLSHTDHEMSMNRLRQIVAFCEKAGVPAASVLRAEGAK